MVSGGNERMEETLPFPLRSESENEFAAGGLQGGGGGDEQGPPLYSGFQKMLYNYSGVLENQK